VPSIFHHNVFPECYITVVYDKLFPIAKEIRHKRILATDLLKREGKLDDPTVSDALMKFSILFVSSVLQKLRIAQMSHIGSLLQLLRKKSGWLKGLSVHSLL